VTCPYCNHVNPEGALFCEECKAFLPDAAITPPAPPAKPVTAVLPPPPAPPPIPPSPVYDSPFGDFLPAWMNSAAPKPASNRQSRPASPAPTSPILIENLLQETVVSPQPGGATTPLRVETATVNPAPARPNPPTGFNGTWPEPAPPLDSTQGLPLPPFQMPPLWFKPPNEIPWQEVRTGETARAVPSNSVGNGYNPTLVGPETHEPAPPEPVGPEYGVDRGFYFFTDPHGNIIVHALAGFGRRLAGAIVDSIISAILGVIFFYLVVVLFLNLDNGNYMQSVLGIALAAVIMPVLLGFLYHTILVGLTGQTFGHRLLRIKVIRRGGQAVGLVSGIVRALYGLAPTFAATFLGIIFPSDASGRNVLASFLSLAIVTLTALGMAWALVDKGHQGLHDKLADTYVVSAKES
jgi:uncharacterized RDD family membrane protein YckC